MRAILLACTVALSPLPCRYTVRDIGFVDLAGPDYVLRLHAGGDSRPRAAIDFEAESNLRFERVTGVGAPRWSLLAEDRTELVFADLDVSGRDLGAGAALERALGSPVLSRISNEAMDTFAFALIVEGNDGERNEALHDLVAEAQERLDQVADQLPRTIDWPLRTIVVGSDGREEERVLLWALGLQAKDFGPEDCALALAYGRGKLAGPVLIGAEIELRELLAQLVLVGESCECETNRAWADEPRLPLRWSDAQRAAASAALGFEPDSPMIKGEVARILARGPKDLADRPRDSIEALLFGYHETDLAGDALAAARGGAANAAGSPPPARTTDLRVVEAGEGDWGFADEPSKEAGAPLPVSPIPETVGSGVRVSLSVVLLLSGALALVLIVIGAVVLATRGREG